MKELKIKEYTLMEDAVKNITTKYFALQVIKSPAENGGYSIHDVLARTKLQNIVNESVDVIKFEDTDFKLFIDLLNKSKWTFSHEDLADFITEVKIL